MQGSAVAACRGRAARCVCVTGTSSSLALPVQVLAMVRSQIELMQKLRAEELVRLAREQKRRNAQRAIQRGADPAELGLDDVQVDAGPVPEAYPWEQSDDEGEPLLPAP